MSACWALISWEHLASIVSALCSDDRSEAAAAEPHAAQPETDQSADCSTPCTSHAVHTPAAKDDACMQALETAKAQPLAQPLAQMTPPVLLDLPGGNSQASAQSSERSVVPRRAMSQAQRRRREHRRHTTATV